MIAVPSISGLAWSKGCLAVRAILASLPGLISSALLAVEDSGGLAAHSGRFAVARVEEQTLPVQEEVVATVRARLEAEIAAQVTGPIVLLTVELGEQVKAGQELIRISETEYQARLRQAQAQLKLAESDRTRQRSLFEKNASDASSLDAAEARYSIALGQVEEASTILSYTTIRAPFDGVITDRLADPGDLATPGRPLLRMEDPRELRAEAHVPEAVAHFLEAGDVIDVRVDSPGLTMKGTVKEISPSADPVSRSFLTKVDLPGHPRLRSGQFARVSVPTGETKRILTPPTAVNFFGQLERVYLLENGLAQLRLVRAGALLETPLGMRREILAGLAAGGEVLLLAEGQRPPLDGQAVEVTR